MNTPSIESVSTKFHTSLNVSDVARSVAFYRVLFGREPARHKRDYAKFELEEPPLVLSLLAGHPGAGGNLNHVGLRVPNHEALLQMQARLETGGLRTQREEGVECCHSTQTKFWVHDPDRTLWEIYLLHAEADEDEHPHASTAATTNAFANDSAPAPKVSWQHTLNDGPIAQVTHDSNSLHEVFLEGSANLHPMRFDLAKLLLDAHRALRPGGEVYIHGLSADARLKNPHPALPGPAAAVQYVPTHTELAGHLHRAGFASVRLERLSDKAHFTGVEDGVGMREIMIAGTRPGHRPQTKNHAAIYLGPFASATDDFGNTFSRGTRVALNIHDWQALGKSAHAAQFLLPKTSLSLARLVTTFLQ